MYELYRASLTEQFENLQSLDSDNMKLEYKDITDKSNSFAESVIRVFDKDYILNVAINLYHT